MPAKVKLYSAFASFQTREMKLVSRVKIREQ